MELRHCLVLATCLAILSCQSNGDTNQTGPEPNGIKKTYANEKLRMNAMQGVYVQLGTQDCRKIDSLEPYVVKRPTGDTGEMNWKERWVVRGCGKVFDVLMQFQEDGAGGAYYRTSLKE